jgi:hypothetical protein
MDQSEPSVFCIIIVIIFCLGILGCFYDRQRSGGTLLFLSFCGLFLLFNSGGIDASACPPGLKEVKYCIPLYGTVPAVNTAINAAPFMKDVVKASAPLVETAKV